MTTPLFIIATTYDSDLSEEQNQQRMEAMRYRLIGGNHDYGVCHGQYDGNPEPSRIIVTKDLSPSEYKLLLNFFLLDFGQECVLEVDNNLHASLRYVCDKVEPLGKLHISARSAQKPRVDHTFVTVPPNMFPEWGECYLTVKEM